MSEPVGRIRELERNRNVATRPEVARPLVEQLSCALFSDHRRQKIEQGDPLVVPLQRPAGFGKQLRLGLAVLSQPVDEAVVSLDHRDLQLRHEEMDVLAGIADQGQAFLVAREVVRESSIVEAEQELGRILAAEEERVSRGTLAVQAFQVEARAADVANKGFVVMVGHRRAVRRDVMGDELPEHGPSGGDRPRLLTLRLRGVTRSARAADRMQKRRIDVQGGQVREHPRIAVSA